MKKKVICIVLYGLLAAACCVFLVFAIRSMYTTHLSLKQFKAIFSSYDNDYKFYHKSYIKSLVYNFFLCITLILVISTLIWQIIIRCANLDFSVRETLEKIKKKRADRKEKSLIKKFERTQKKYKELEEEINRKGA
nr:MAG TPA: hypothetical protein [Caudoviricetes sp.]